MQIFFFFLHLFQATQVSVCEEEKSLESGLGKTSLTCWTYALDNT